MLKGNKVAPGAYVDISGAQIGGNANIYSHNGDNIYIYSSHEIKECIISWETLIKCVKAKYLQESKVKTVFGEAQEISRCYVNLAIVEEKEQREKEKFLAKGACNQSIQTQEQSSKQKSVKQALEREDWLNSYEEIHGAKIPISPQDIHKPQEGKVLHRQLILGRAGIGKSTLCQYLAYQWAKEGWWKEEIFKLLIWIPLRQLINEKIYPKEEQEAITLGRVFYEQFKEQLHTELPAAQNTQWIEALDNLIKTHATEILYVLDGFDEVANVCQLDDREASRQTEILRQLLKQERIVITSRPYYIDNYLNTQGIKIDRRLENIGFVDKDIQDYVQRYPWKEPEQQKTLRSLLNSNSLMRGIAHIPINLGLLCRYWSTQAVKEHYINMTDLYENLVGDLLYEYLGKGRGYIDFVNSTTSSILNNKKAQPILQFLEKLAFLQMQEESLLISKERIAYLLGKYENNIEVNEWQGFKSVLGAGLLVSPDGQEKCFEDRREHYFIHLTFQEFLAARYIARVFRQYDNSVGEIALLEGSKQDRKISNQSLTLFMQNHKYDLRYEIVWWFVAGLLKDHREGIERFFNSLLSVPHSLSGWYDVLLLIKCLEESKLTDNLSEVLKNDLVEKIKKIAQAALDRKAYISGKQYSKTFFEYLFSSPIVYKELGILQTQEALREALQWHLNLPSSVLEKMGNLLNDENKEIRSSVLSALSKQPNLSVSVLEKMGGLLRDENVRCSALSALGQQPNLPDSVLEKMEGLLRDENENVRRSALNTLGQQPNLSVSVLEIMGGLLRDEDKEVRSSVLNALGQQPNLPISILEKMGELLRDENKYVKISALSALGQQPDLPISVLKKMRGLLRDENKYVKISALFALSKQPNLPVSILEEMEDLLRDKDEVVKIAVLSALGQQPNLPDSVLEKMKGLLRDENGYVRIAVLYALGQQPNLPISVLEKMEGLLRDEDKEVRSSVLNALGQQPNLPISILEEMGGLLRDENENVRSSALYALGRQLDLPVSVLKKMGGLLRNKNKNVRSSALSVLGKQSNLPVSVSEKMVGLLRDEDENVRCSALDVLGQQPNLSPSMLTELVSLLNDEDWYIRRSALSVLGKQPGLPVSVLSKVITFVTEKNQIYGIYDEKINFINQQLIPLLDSPDLQSQLSSTPKLLSDLILKNTFSSKNVAYFENNQSLIIQLGQQLKKIKIKDKNKFLQVFIQQRKLWLNDEIDIEQIDDKFSLSNLSKHLKECCLS